MEQKVIMHKFLALKLVARQPVPSHSRHQGPLNRTIKSMSKPKNPKNNPPGFAQRLKVLRMQKMFSQTELGNLAGIHFTTISRYERGEALPNTDALQGLSRALEVSADFLLHGQDTQAKARVTGQDAELLQQFQEVESLPAEEKAFVKKVLEALLLRRRVQSLAV